MVVSIVQDTAPFSAPTHTTPAMTTCKQFPSLAPSFQRSGSTTTESQSSRSVDGRSDTSDHSTEMHSRITTVVRGFSPAKVPIPGLSPSPLPTAVSGYSAIPEPRSSPAAKAVPYKKKPTFALGASCSSSEMGQSLDTTRVVFTAATAPKKPVFQIGGSSEEEGSLKSAMHSSRPGSLISASNKQASFSNQISTIPAEEAVVDSDTDYVDESAIDDDDDSSDWEDSIEDSGKSSMDEKFFRRVDSKVNLTSRPSLITLMLAQNHRVMALSNQASQSTSAISRPRGSQNGPALGASPNDSDEAPLMMKGTRSSNLKPIIEMPRSSAQPIAATTSRNYAHAALSPRTTRRNMLATELTESLRRHLLWERQQKSSTANAVLKRRHTSQDVANLKQYPEKACMKEDDDSNTWNQFFSKDALDGYHSKGW